MYTVLFLDNCGYSHAARELLDKNNLKYELLIFSKNIKNSKEKYFKNYEIGEDDEGNIIYPKQMFKDQFGENATFPRIYKDDNYIGGYIELELKFK